MRILLVEDDDAEAALVEAWLDAHRGEGDLHLERAPTLADGIAALARAKPDVVLLDVSLPDSDHGLAGLDRVMQAAPGVPIVMRTGHDDDQMALDAVRKGAHDYLIKGDHSPALLWRSLRAAIARGAHPVEERARFTKLVEAETAMVSGLRARARGSWEGSGLRAGMQLGGRYSLREPLAAGSSGQLYAATDLQTGEDVCVKHVRVGAGDVVATELAREARLAATLRHPRLVRMLDFGTIWGEPYLVMELVPGGSLADRLAAGPLPPERATSAMLDVLDGLAYMHARDTLHLDLKPANVLLDAEGRAKIGDFGIALPASGRGWDETQSGLGAPRVVGTPAYVSPEVVVGLPPTPRSDLYSAGALLYHLLAGRPYLDLHGLDLFAVRAAIRATTPSRDAPGGPLLDVALRALEKAPEARYADARAMREALLAASGGRAVAVDAADERARDLATR